MLRTVSLQIRNSQDRQLSNIDDFFRRAEFAARRRRVDGYGDAGEFNSACPSRGKRHGRLAAGGAPVYGSLGSAAARANGAVGGSRRACPAVSVEMDRTVKLERDMRADVHQVGSGERHLLADIDHFFRCAEVAARWTVRTARIVVALVSGSALDRTLGWSRRLR